MTVYIVQRPRPNKDNWTPNFSSADKYGAIEFVFESHHQAFSAPEPSIAIARDILKGFNYKEDYILWPGMGDPIGLAIVMGVVHEFAPEYIKMLHWNRQQHEDGTRNYKAGFYSPVTINFTQKGENYGCGSC